MKKLYILALFTCISISGYGQAIRLNLSGLNFGSPTNYYLGLGYEQNIGTRLAVSLETNFGVGSIGDEYNDVTFSESGIDYSADYTVMSYWYEIAYQSKYFFTANDFRAFYIGPGLAYRKYTFDVEETYQQINAYGNYNYGTQDYKQKTALFPVSLKLGYRGAIDKFFVDFSLGMTYMPGAGSTNLSVPHLDQNISDPLLDPFYINMCFAIGVGWAK